MKVELIFVLAAFLATCNGATLSNKSQDLSNSTSQRVRGECLEPPDHGSCDYETIERFYYDAEEKTCKTFIFGGCDGNSNHFGRFEKCLQYCQKSPEEVCRQPRDHGPCRAIDYVYHYDAAQKKCVKFEYGGCRGNDNNFYSAEICQDFCDGV